MAAYSEKRVPVSLVILWTAVFLATGVFLWGTWRYRQIVDLEESLEMQRSRIELQFQYRSAAAQRLVEELDAQEDTGQSAPVRRLSRAQDRLEQAGSLREKLQADDALNAVLRELQGDAGVQRWMRSGGRDLMRRLSEMDETIETLRAQYNRLAEDYNDRSSTFPGVVITGMFGFDPVEPLMAS